MYWYINKFRQTSFTGIEYTRSLFDQNSPYQSIKILETKGFGNMLVIDDIIMSCEKDEFIYSEMISHVPLFSHPHPKDVLIIGGGDGGTAREVLKHENINQCFMVEIDELVVSASKKYLKSAMSFNNPKLNLNIEDGASFIARQKEAFDIIIVDSAVNSPSAVLYGRTFYKNVHKALKKDGLIVANYFDHFYNIEQNKRILEIITESGFKKVGSYGFNNISFPPGICFFVFASKGPHPIKDFKSERVKSSGLSFRYYNEEIHKASFARVQFIKEFLGKSWTL